MLQTKENVSLKNLQIKRYLEELMGDSIQFCKSDIKNQSTMVCSSSLSVVDVMNTLRSLNSIKTAVQVIRRKLLDIDFGLQDKFCDSE